MYALWRRLYVGGMSWQSTRSKGSLYMRDLGELQAENLAAYVTVPVMALNCVLHAT